MSLSRYPVAVPALCLFFASFLGCLREPLVKPPGDPGIGIRVLWQGHSCFTIEDSVGRQFLVDPFGENVGPHLVWGKPEVVLVTHEHFDHNHLRRRGEFELLNSTGTHTLSGVEVSGYLGFHDNKAGRLHGTIRIYVWEMGGLRIAHMSDIGQWSLSPKQKEALKDIDLLFIPVGGKTTVDGMRAAGLVNTIQPRVAVPMHYGNDLVRFYEFDRVDVFLKNFENVLELPDSGFQLRREELPKKLTIFVPRVPQK